MLQLGAMTLQGFVCSKVSSFEDTEFPFGVVKFNWIGYNVLGN